MSHEMLHTTDGLNEEKSGGKNPQNIPTYSASKLSEQHLGEIGLTAGRVGRARFFSSCFLGTFSGRWRGEPSDLEEALLKRRKGEMSLRS